MNDFIMCVERTYIMLSDTLLEIYNTNNNDPSWDKISSLVVKSYIDGLNKDLCPFEAQSSAVEDEIYKITEISEGFGTWLVYHVNSYTTIYSEEIGDFITNK